MIGVGGLVGLAHREKGQRARADVEHVVRAFREQRERAGRQAGGELDPARAVLAAIEATAARRFSAGWSSAGCGGLVAKASRPM